jgi:hypothetical protein
MLCLAPQADALFDTIKRKFNLEGGDTNGLGGGSPEV